MNIRKKSFRFFTDDDEKLGFLIIMQLSHSVRESVRTYEFLVADFLIYFNMKSPR